MGSLLNIGLTGLNAAQAGINTTGHNISNADTAGYSRQVVVQTTASATNMGYGYIGQGTAVATVQRSYSELLAKQINSSQSSSSSLQTYYAQMSTINNMLADATAGLSPAIQDFFGSVQNLSTNPSDSASRQALLSSSQALASRLQSQGDRFAEIQSGVNTELTNNVAQVNSYASQIAALNESIEKAAATNGKPPNDLMDQRDQLVTELSSLIKTSVVKQGENTYNIFIGNGLPLVMNSDTLKLAAVNSPSESNRIEVAYQTNTSSSILSASTLSGGTIGGLLEFREDSLDELQNQIGQIALVLADTFNTQHEQGVDITGAPGGKFFSVSDPEVYDHANNTGSAVIASKVTDSSAVTTSDYRLQYDGSNYTITRLSDNQAQSFNSLPQEIDGVSFAISSGSMSSGDQFLIKPTAGVAASIASLITDVNKIAVGGPALSSTANSSNAGSGTISALTVNSDYAASPLAAGFTLTYNSSPSGNLTGFPAGQAVTVTSGSTTTTFAAGAAVTYTPGATITVGNFSFQLSGTPSDTDQFSIAPSTGASPGDNRNALLLAGLQTQKTINNGSQTYEGAFGQVVSSVGNKTRELKVTGDAESTLLAQANESMQSLAGVNLDEEATNLLRYQQAYQASGKVMAIASELFDVLLSLGN